MNVNIILTLRILNMKRTVRSKSVFNQKYKEDNMMT